MFMRCFNHSPSFNHMNHSSDSRDSEIAPTGGVDFCQEGSTGRLNRAIVLFLLFQTEFFLQNSVSLTQCLCTVLIIAHHLIMRITVQTVAIRKSLLQERVGCGTMKFRFPTPKTSNFVLTHVKSSCIILSKYG